MRRAFGAAMVKIAEKRDDLFVLTGDVVQNMDVFRERWPERFLNLGICEQAITSIAAGMASEGLRPFIYSITPFVLERPFEQIKIDIDEQRLPVTLVGYSGYPSHGPTHRPVNPRVLASALKNTMSYFPASLEEAESNLLDAYIMREPAFVSLTRVGNPVL